MNLRVKEKSKITKIAKTNVYSKWKVLYKMKNKSKLKYIKRMKNNGHSPYLIHSLHEVEDGWLNPGFKDS